MVPAHRSTHRPPLTLWSRHLARHKTLGLIGAGNIGSALARLAVAAGLNVVLSNSRGPETLAGLFAELGEQARAATPAEAAQAGDLVVATVPLNTYAQLPAAALAGRTVIDTRNYYPERDDRIAELDTGEQTSSALVQRHLAGSQVVKAFNSIDFVRLFTSARPADAEDRSAPDSWRSEPGTAVYVQPYLPARPQGLTQEEMGRWFFAAQGVPVGPPVRRVGDRATAWNTAPRYSPTCHLPGQAPSVTLGQAATRDTTDRGHRTPGSRPGPRHPATPRAWSEGVRG